MNWKTSFLIVLIITNIIIFGTFYLITNSFRSPLIALIIWDFILLIFSAIGIINEIEKIIIKKLKTKAKIEVAKK